MADEMSAISVVHVREEDGRASGSQLRSSADGEDDARELTRARPVPVIAGWDDIWNFFFGTPPPADAYMKKATDIRSYVLLDQIEMGTPDNKCYGGYCELSTYRPRVEDGDMSLLQIGMLNIAPDKWFQSVEAGWQRFGNKHGDDTEARLFVFFTTNNYNNGSQADNVSGFYPEVSGWFQEDREYRPGMRLPYSHTGSTPQPPLRLKWYLDLDRWYLRVNGRTIGYFPGSLFRDARPAGTPTLGDYANVVNFQGEVANRDSPGPTTTDMGSGMLPGTGIGSSGFIRKMQYQKKPTRENADMTDATAQRGYPTILNTTPDKYSFEFHPSGPKDWGSYMLLGGPGAPVTTWIDWETIGGVFIPGGPITAVSRKQDQIDLFICGLNGNVYTCYFTPAIGWSHFDKPWAWIGTCPGGFMPGSRVTAVFREQDILDLFITGWDSVVYNSWWTPEDGWSGLGGWRPIGTNKFLPGSPVSAITRSWDSIDLFAAAPGSKLYTMRWVDGFDWPQAWTDISPRLPSGTIFNPNANIGVVSRMESEMWIFVIGTDNQVYFASWTERRTPVEWDGAWVSIGGAPGGVFDPSNPITVISRREGVVDVFVNSSDQRIYTTRWEPAGWEMAWRPIGGSTKVVDDPTYVPTVVSRKPDWLDAFFCDRTGKVYSCWWSESSDTWSDWFSINGDFQSWIPLAPAAHVTATSRGPGNLDVFAIDTKGIVNQTQWEGT